MLSRGRAGAAVVVAAAVCGSACSESRAPGCATLVSAQVCATPSNLRGAELVPDEWSREPAPELLPEPLVDGRYVLTGRHHYCSSAQPAPEAGVLNALEISGCVLRETSVVPPAEGELVRAATFEYAADGTLAVTFACMGPQRASAWLYGFDGNTLLLDRHSEPDTTDQVEGCERRDIERYELR
jgi:hypothetical protein